MRLYSLLFIFTTRASSLEGFSKMFVNDNANQCTGWVVFFMRIILFVIFVIRVKFIFVYHFKQQLLIKTRNSPGTATITGHTH